MDDLGFKPQQGQEIFHFFEDVQTDSEAPSFLILKGHDSSFPGVKWPEYEFNSSPPSSAEIKNGWSCTSSPPSCHLQKRFFLLVIALKCPDLSELIF